MIKKMLDLEVAKRDSKDELQASATPDPIWVAREHGDEFVSLLCALFAYGNTTAIVKYLRSLEFSSLEFQDEADFEKLTCGAYRFQTPEDVKQILMSLNRIKKEVSLNELFLSGYEKNSQVIEGISKLIETIYDINSYRSSGYEFLIGKNFKNEPKSPLKRWNMYLRWMVRKNEIDMGLWSGVKNSDLLMPLDTHTHKVALKLGLMERKSYDFKSVLELTCKLREFDKNDPIKYDFALYRLGQEKLI